MKIHGLASTFLLLAGGVNSHEEGPSTKKKATKDFFQVGVRRSLDSEAIHRRTTAACSGGERKIVECKDGISEEVCKEDLIEAGVQVVADMPHTSFFAVCVESKAHAELVATLTDVEGIEDDPIRTTSYLPDSRVDRHLQEDEQVVPYGVDLVKAPEFWDTYSNRGAGVKVCVIDTGIRGTHEDLKDGALTGSNDRDLVTPWNQDGNSHGTHCSGTIAAQDNSKGVVGVAPDASLHTVRVFDDSGLFTASGLVEAMNACADAGSDIISMSLGGGRPTIAERITANLLRDQGILLVAAAGNSGDLENPLEFPAGYGPVMSVAAADSQSRVAFFSTHNDEVDITGPGVDVLSTISESDSSYAEFSGTSMATPHVAGVAALLWSQFQEKNADEIRDAIQESARDVGACGKDRLFGHGMVDVMAAAAYLQNGNLPVSELGDCLPVDVSLLTDDYGEETTYSITSLSDEEDIVYRGGPYPRRRREIYTDNIQLPDGCYNLQLLDSYGDGNSDDQYGRGEVLVSYNGVQQIFFNNFEGSNVTLQFGNCFDGEDTSPSISSSSAISSPACGNGVVEGGEECDDGNTVNGDGCDSLCSKEVASEPSPEEGECAPGETRLGLVLQTDEWAKVENELYFYDADGPEDDFVWNMALGDLSNESFYEERTCIDSSRCYKFYFFDKWGDGLKRGGLTLFEGDEVLLQIDPFDKGTSVDPNGAPKSYWFATAGTCP